MKYKRIYQMLKYNGHTSLKAAQIILDAVRGNEFAINWIKCLFVVRKR